MEKGKALGDIVLLCCKLSLDAVSFVILLIGIYNFQ